MGEGFRIGRYEPSAPGDGTFWVDRPWYRGTRDVAVGLVLDYAHDPLVLGRRGPKGFEQTSAVIQHQLIGHATFAFAPLDWLNLSLSLPVTLWEDGTAAVGITPRGQVTVGDPRLTSFVRLVGDARRDPFALSLGLSLWLPLDGGDGHAGDPGLRAMPRLVAGGRAGSFVWSGSAAFLYRPTATIGTLPEGLGNTTGPEAQVGGFVGYADEAERWLVGPEAMAATVVTDGRAFQQSSTSVEALLGAHHRVGDFVIGLAGGTGFLHYAGTPDARALLRVSWAPVAKAAEPARAAVEPIAPPPPPPDRDGDGIADADDACVDQAGVPSSDRSKDGCPPDADSDGILDADDQCPREAKGEHPDPSRKGCPAGDRDGDGVLDHEDACVDQAAGADPDPDKKGCPAGDRDGDTIVDPKDACPDKVGAPSPDPKKHGCPGLVEVRDGKIVILKPIFFATGKDKILRKSYPVLDGVVDALRVQPKMRVLVEGHTDNKGKPAKNLDLSERRASSVRRYLVGSGIAPDRVEAKGFGQERPIAPNKKAKGRAANRRVEFKILEGGPGTTAP